MNRHKCRFQPFIPHSQEVRGYPLCESPSYIVHRYNLEFRSQHGLIVALDLASSKGNPPLPHEKTRTKKVEELKRHFSMSEWDENIIMLITRWGDKLSQACRAVASKSEPIITKSGQFGKEEFFLVNDSCVNAEISNLLNEIGDIVIADGHHRVEALRCSLAESEFPEQDTQILALLLPETEISVLSYNRIVKLQHGVELDEMITFLRERFQMRSVSPVTNSSNIFGDEILIVSALGFFTLRLPDEEKMKPSLSHRLQEEILIPYFELNDPETSDRIEFVQGDLNTHSLSTYIENNHDRIAFILPPPSLEEIFKCAQWNSLYPPHSTYFPLKPASFLIRERQFMARKSNLSQPQRE
ncbi:DUF1015 family protein [Fluviispira multicolorata]|nr:DUF1015 family protein [Fluviispira multicolorata]